MSSQANPRATPPAAEAQSHAKKASWKSHISGYLVTGSCCSFYDDAGRIDEEAFVRLTAAAGLDVRNLVGWFRMRTNTPLRPSIRDHAVHSSLQDRLPNKMLMYLSLSDTCDASHIMTYSYRAFHITPFSMALPLPVVIQNNTHPSHTEYEVLVNQHSCAMVFPHASRFDRFDRFDRFKSAKNLFQTGRPC